MIEVTFTPGGKRIDIEAGQSLLAAGRQLSISATTTSIEAPCGGKGRCGQCRVQVTRGKVAPATEIEKAWLDSAEIAHGQRLACQCVPLEQVSVYIPPETRSGEVELQITGPAPDIRPATLLQRIAIPLTSTTLENPKSFWQQITQALVTDHGIDRPRLDPRFIRQTPALASEATVTVSLREETVVAVYTDNIAPPPVGLAIDLGTTKIAGYLIDMQTGSVLAAEGIMNPQSCHGSDVVSRLAHAVENKDQARNLSLMVRDCIGHLADILTRRQGLKSTHIEETVVAGNTAMHHLLLEWPVTQLCRAPFVPAATVPVELCARDLGMNFAIGSQLYLIPPIAGYVGGDHAAMILASRIYQAEGISLGLDIGTNTEIVLNCRGKLFSCSCASGPAFEGAQIRQGVRAVEGAVYKIHLDDQGRVHCQTIANAPPIGLCGSGVVDAVAELVRTGIVNSIGLMQRDHPQVRIDGPDDEPLFLLASAHESGATRDLEIGQQDICAIQLAKAAVAAGIRALLANASVSALEIDRVLVAGAFGTHLNLDSAIALGMLPNLPLARFSQIGNAAGTGARMVLISEAERGLVEDLSRRVNYLELGADPEFSRFLAQGLQFRPFLTTPS